MKCKTQFFIIVLELLFFDVSSENGNGVVFSWECKKNTCIKEIRDNQLISEITSFNVCKLFCGSSIFWPLPTSYIMEGPARHIKSFISEENFSKLEPMIPQKLKKMIIGAENVFLERINKEKSQTSEVLSEGKYKLQIRLDINDFSHQTLTLDTNEDYTLIISEQSDYIMLAVIQAETFFGVRNGLETLAQLIVYDYVRNGLVMPNYSKIIDKPQYPYRGILLDTSRNYFSVNSIKRTIDIMAANKLNSFHWHITDSQSFPLMLDNFRQFAEHGAYSLDKIYTENDIKSIMDYALIRGIRIVPELDAPAHTGEGWQWTPKDTILCFNKEPWKSYCYEPPCGQLNPLSEHVYTILGELYKDYIRLFKPDIFHMGGDEVHFGCWSTSEEILKWVDNYLPVNETMERINDGSSYNRIKKSDSITKKGYIALWSKFQEKALEKLKEASKDTDHKPEAVIWTSDLTANEYLNKYVNNTDYIVQVWTTKYDPIINELLENNFRIILSNCDALYFDSGFGSWVSDFSDSIYRAWHSVYENMPEFIKYLPHNKKDLVLGQEAALWSEMASEGSLDSRLWPRAAALAERTWTNPKTSWREAESRILYHRDRLVRLGANADAIEPEWCNLNRGGCS